MSTCIQNKSLKNTLKKQKDINENRLKIIGIIHYIGFIIPEYFELYLRRLGNT